MQSFVDGRGRKPYTGPKRGGKVFDPMTLNILNTAVGLLLLMAVGYLCSRIGLIDEEAERKLSGLLLNVVQPAYLIVAYQRPFDRGLARDFLVCLAMAAAAFLVMILLPYLFFPKGSRDREVGLLTVAFPNVGFFGIPLVSGVYGPEGVFFLTTMITMFNLMLWTYGVLLMSGQRGSLKETAKRLVSPSLVAIVAGLLCFSLGLLLPEVLVSPLRKLGDMNSPLAMLISGAVVARANFKQGLRDPLVYKISLLRVLAVPMAVALLLFRLPVDPMLVTIVVLSSGFPVGSMPLMFCVRYGKNGALAGECVALTSVLCCVTAPVIYLFLNFLRGAF